MGPGYGVERVSVGPHTLKKGNKRGDWMKQWLMIQKFTALDTMNRKNAGKASYPQDTTRYKKTVGPYIGGQETYVFQQ